MSLDPITALLDVGKAIIGKWPDANKRAEALFKLEDLKQRGDLAVLDAHVKQLVGQLDINKVEAAHSSLFVAGWRPFVGWCCGFALVYVSIVEPIMRFVATMIGYTGEFPVIDTNITLQVLLGMLGLGAMRSHDKRQGVDTKGVKR